jgi:hypothetical protein
MWRDKVIIESIKPGILVAGKIYLKGGIRYKREYSPSQLDNNTLVREWNTVAIVEDIKEREEADRVRSSIYSKLRRVCVHTHIGMICPLEKKEELEKTLEEANFARTEFNNKANTCSLEVYYALFELKSDNAEVLSAIASQVQEGLEKVNSAIKMEDLRAINLAPKRFLEGLSPNEIISLPEKQRDVVIARIRAELIRAAAKSMKDIDLLIPENKEIKQAISSAKNIAKRIYTLVEKRNYKLQEVLDGVNLVGINRSQILFIQTAQQAKEKSKNQMESKSLLSL